MSDNTTTKTSVRYVRCPRCPGILLESPDVPLYICGGCGTTLRAKNRKDVANSIDREYHSNQLTPSKQEELYPSTSQLSIFFPAEASESEDLGKMSLSTPALRNNGKTTSFSDDFSSEDKKKKKQVGQVGEVDRLSKSPPNNQNLVSPCSSPSSTEKMNDTSSSKSHEFVLPDSESTSSIGGTLVEVTPDNNNTSTTALEAEEDKLSGISVVEDKVDDTHMYLSTSSHAYDGSVSSFEGWDYQIPDHHKHHLFVQGLFEPQSVSEIFDPVSNKINTDINLQLGSSRYEKLSTKSLPEKQPSDIILDKKTNNVNQQDSTLKCTEEQKENHLHNLKVTRQSVENWMPSSDKEEILLPRKTIYNRKVPSADYYHNAAGPSTLRSKEFVYKSGLHPTENEIPHDQLELLRKVEELRNHLHRSYAQRGRTNGRFSIRSSQQIDKDQPVCYYSHQLSDHPWNHSQPHRPCNSVPFQSKVRFSGKSIECRHHADYKCLHGCTEQCQYPQPNCCRVDHVCYHPCQPSNEFKSTIWCRNSDPLPHDQRHQVEKPYHCDRRNPIKRHWRPIAGGSPIIICHSCRKLVQLPADFLVSNKIYHKLRCGSCSRVLVFQFHKGTSVPFRVNPTAPPPSEVDNSSSAPLPSKYHVSISRASEKEYKSPEESSSSSQPLSGAKLEKLKQVQRSSGSPLHKLMGYSSPTQMMEGSDDESPEREPPKWSYRNVERQ